MMNDELSSPPFLSPVLVFNCSIHPFTHYSFLRQQSNTATASVLGDHSTPPGGAELSWPWHGHWEAEAEAEVRGGKLCRSSCATHAKWGRYLLMEKNRDQMNGEVGRVREWCSRAIS